MVHTDTMDTNAHGDGGEQQTDDSSADKEGRWAKGKNGGQQPRRTSESYNITKTSNYLFISYKLMT